jgi:hypothetical protein
MGSVSLGVEATALPLEAQSTAPLSHSLLNAALLLDILQYPREDHCEAYINENIILHREKSNYLVTL